MSATIRLKGCVWKRTTNQKCTRVEDIEQWSQADLGWSPFPPLAVWPWATVLTSLSLVSPSVKIVMMIAALDYWGSKGKVSESVCHVLHSFSPFFSSSPASFQGIQGELPPHPYFYVSGKTQLWGKLRRSLTIPACGDYIQAPGTLSAHTDPEPLYPLELPRASLLRWFQQRSQPCSRFLPVPWS